MSWYRGGFHTAHVSRKRQLAMPNGVTSGDARLGRNRSAAAEHAETTARALNQAETIRMVAQGSLVQEPQSTTTLPVSASTAMAGWFGRARHLKTQTPLRAVQLLSS
jgi:hypothetical protein